ncbi:MAG: hypothetical protein IPM50_11635 [Acidobacteriota bacterium]|nr:MAG: hypothetical protein IPM50_11635 [Acidobacteriota bacterium]
MRRFLPGGRLGIVISALALSLVAGLVFFSEQASMGKNGDTGTVEKMIVAGGTATMDMDITALNGAKSRSRESSMRFDAARDTFFTIIVFNGELRAMLPSAMELGSTNSIELPAKLAASRENLILEVSPIGAPYELVVRDSRDGFGFFNIEGPEVNYDPNTRAFTITGGRMLITEEFAAALGRASDAGKIVGQINVNVTMRPIEVATLVDGEATENKLPAGAGMSPEAGTVPGPDVIVGDLVGLAQFGSAANNQVGLAVGTDSCNAGTIDLNWNALPSNDHPVIGMNLYRMSGGADNAERFEMVGHSALKHGFTALTQNICGFGCNGVGGSRLGSGCSDPYSASLNSGPNLGSRAWVNPFTGFFPRGDSATPPNNHSGHTHTGPSHRILVGVNDLITTQNPGAAYFAEGQYVTPHEYAWCQSNPGQCNQYNNVSYRRYNVSGTAAPFSFSPNGSTQREKIALNAWTGATISEVHPAPGVDGKAFVGYKVTNPSAGVWRYEYAIYNMNLDRAIQSFGVPIGNGVTLTNVQFYAPPQHPGWSADGTDNSQGFSSAPWTESDASGYKFWSSETFAQNPNANAIRWGTMYNVRFDSNRPPVLTDGRMGFFKTGQPITVRVLAPQAGSPTCSRVPQGNRC